MSKAAELAALIGSQTALSNRNLIINGEMEVSQRGTTFADLANGGFCVDRFIIFHSDDGAVTVSQDTTVPAGQGFKNSMKFDVTTADTSIGAAQFYQFAQKIEGQNMAHLEWGTSNAKSVTLSFWIRSNVTGTYNVYFLNNAVNRYHPVNFTIDSADTWEKKIITVAGDTTGTWLTTNGVGMFVLWNLAIGSDYLTGTNATWGTAGPAVSGTTQANFLSSTSNELYITGVQLEKGDVATAFEHEDYTTTLTKCRRYYQKLEGGTYFGGFYAYTGSTGIRVPLIPSMRAAPTVTNYAVRNGSSGATASNIAAQYGGIDGFSAPIDGAGGADTNFCHINQSFLEASAEL